MNRLVEINNQIKALTDERERLRLEEHKVEVADEMAKLQDWVGAYFEYGEDAYCLGIRVLKPERSWDDPYLEYVEMNPHLSYGYTTRYERLKMLKKFGHRSKAAKLAFLARWLQYSNFVNDNIQGAGNAKD